MLIKCAVHILLYRADFIFTLLRVHQLNSKGMRGPQIVHWKPTEPLDALRVISNKRQNLHEKQFQC